MLNRTYRPARLAALAALNLSEVRYMSSCSTCNSCTGNNCGCDSCTTNACGCSSCDSCSNCNTCSNCCNSNACSANACGCNSCGCNPCGCGPFNPNFLLHLLGLNGFGCNFCGCDSGNGSCPFPQWIHPIQFNPTHFCDAGSDSGATLVIHKIVLEPCANQSCTPTNFTLRITGPSFPCGETFTIRAGSCLTLDEPLVLSGLEPGVYEIEELSCCGRNFISTLTGPVCGRCVNLIASRVPTVVTIVNRRRIDHCCRNTCGC